MVRGDGEGFTVTVGQAFGNCPQYIQTRRVALSRPPHPHSDAPVERATALDAAAIAMIAAADTFFVTSYAEPDGDPGQRAVDTSHRGGRPGFVRIDGNVLTIPDFAGNLYFNTLGNLLLNPRAGLLIEPAEFFGDLQRELARRRNDERKRLRRSLEPLGSPEQRTSDGKAEGHGLA